MRSSGEPMHDSVSRTLTCMLSKHKNKAQNLGFSSDFVNYHTSNMTMHSAARAAAMASTSTASQAPESDFSLAEEIFSDEEEFLVANLTAEERQQFNEIWQMHIKRAAQGKS